MDFMKRKNYFPDITIKFQIIIKNMEKQLYAIKDSKPTTSEIKIARTLLVKLLSLDNILLFRFLSIFFIFL